MPLPIFLYLPNILCYVRVSLAFWGLHLASSQPVKAVLVWVVSCFLDLVDGILARLLHQTSSFGVVLDIAADNILRSCVWIAVVVANPAYSLPVALVVNLEWFTMVATQVHAASNQSHWKASREKDPWIVRYFFSNNFRNPLGILGIYGLFAANIFIYGSLHPTLYNSIPYFNYWMFVALVGRGLSACIEIWFLASFFAMTLEKDSSQRSVKATETPPNKKL